MGTKYSPPDFFDEVHEYAEYRRKLLRWSRISKVEKKKQAEVVVYSLEGHPSGIQEKIDAAISDEIEDKEDGMDKLIAFLHKIYKLFPIQGNSTFVPRRVYHLYTV